MFGSVGQIVKALKAYRDNYYDPRSSSTMIATSRDRDIDADPFRFGFLDTLDLRSELLRRLSSLDERERAVILLWYVKDLSVKSICEQMDLSRSHCYRLRDKGLAQMLDPVAEMSCA